MIGRLSKNTNVIGQPSKYTNVIGRRANKPRVCTTAKLAPLSRRARENETERASGVERGAMMTLRGGAVLCLRVDVSRPSHSGQPTCVYVRGGG